MASRILTIDIETKPAKAYTWGLYNVNISLNQLIEPSAPICFSAKFLGEKEIHFHADWIDGHDEMIRRAHELLTEADAVIGYNHVKFDLPKLQGEFALLGLAPPPPPTCIDLLKTVKKLGLQSNKLAFVGPFFKIGRKIENEGFNLWVKVMEGDTAAQKRMQRYCEGDVKLTERVYELLKSYVPNHPYLGDVGSSNCPTCESGALQKRGFYRTRAFVTQRLQCQSCGAWSQGTRKKV